MAHAIYGYPGKCKNLHGHSYELHVTVGTVLKQDDYIAAPGFIMDFKDLKHLVQQLVINKLDHNIILSEDYIRENNSIATSENICIWQKEPTAENILIFIKRQLQEKLLNGVQLIGLKLYETNDSYAEWINTSSQTTNGRSI